MSATIVNFINGELVPSQGTRTSSVYNPATGEQSGTIGLATMQDVQLAVAAARKALPAWANTLPCGARASSTASCGLWRTKSISLPK